MTRGRRAVLAGLAAVVAAALGWLAVSANRPAAGARRAQLARASGRTDVVARSDAGPPPAAKTLAPRRAEGDAGAAGGAPGGVAEYLRDDGTLVRDHRGADEPPPARAVSQDTSVRVRRGLRELFKDCGRQLRARDRKARGRVQAVVTASIRAGRVTVEALDLQIEGLSDSEYEACVRRLVEGATVDAPAGQRDVDAHTFTVQYAVP